MTRPRRLLAWLLASCGGFVSCGSPQARAPGGGVGLPTAFAAAFRADATGDSHDAVAATLAVARAAASADRDPWQLAALQASLDALATRTMPSLGEMAGDAALAQRTREGGDIVRELSRDSRNAKGVFARSLIARALRTLAERRGDAVDAEAQRAATGCVRDALVVGPLSWTPITGVSEPDPFDHPDAKIEAAYSIGDPFDTRVRPTRVGGRGCRIPLSAESVSPGVRDVIVDVDVPKAQTIGVVLRAHGAAEVRTGGLVVLKRPFELGDGEAARFAHLRVDAGALRLVTRAGTAKDDDWLEIDVLGEDGMPLRTHAPALGSSPRRGSVRIDPILDPAPATDDELLLASAAAIAAGDSRTAERELWKAAHANASPALALVYGRALETSRDLSQATRAERARGAYQRVVEAWPGAWEATIADAVLAGVRRGKDEAGLEVLRNLDSVQSKLHGPSVPLVDAFDGVASAREHLFDRARAALERARATLGATSFFVHAEDSVGPQAGPHAVAAVCDLSLPVAHDSLDCFDALRDAGDRSGVGGELARLRKVLGAPSRFLSFDFRDALLARDPAAALRAFAAMLPAERTLSELALVSPTGRATQTRDALLQLAATARDSPVSLGPLMDVLGDDVSAAFDERADRIATEDRAKTIMPASATAVLAHDERYTISPQGMVHWVLFDVRRVSGTTDVEENPSAPGPDVWGRGATRTVRRRILKKDGRVVEPDRAPRATQAHADLSQLETGDVVEAVYEGYSLPGDTGDVGIDTPDLLPDRSAVKDATLEIRMPHWLRTSLWSHPLLGKPAERDDEGTRVLTWHVADQAERLIEDRVPRMDRSVRVSVSTMVWSRVGRALRETLAAFDEHDPEIAEWARGVVGGAPRTARSAVEAVVAAAGKELREGDSDILSDYGGGVTAVQDRTARASLSAHQGSRSWLIVRALRELGIASDVVVAEDDPFSADPAFPPHFARFVHPLVVAHLTDPAIAASARDIWIDPDVAGPVLPAGRVSPELRGRLALYPDGTIAPLPATTETDHDRDEIDIRLALDGAGNARGTFAVLLQGRSAQSLAESLVRMVGAERQRALRDVVLAWLPWANVDDVTLASAEGSWQVGLRADVSVGGYAQAQGDETWLLPGSDTLHWAWPRARISSLGATFAARADRESALAVSTALQYHMHRKVELPAGAVVARLPGPVDVATELLQASRKLTVETGENGNVIDEDFSLAVATGTVAKADYGRFVTAAHAADDGFLASARVSRASPASRAPSAAPQSSASSKLHVGQP
jgi:hypothetical protein